MTGHNILWPPPALINYEALVDRARVVDTFMPCSQGTLWDIGLLASGRNVDVPSEARVLVRHGACGWDSDASAVIQFYVARLTSPTTIACFPQ